VRKDRDPRRRSRRRKETSCGGELDVEVSDVVGGPDRVEMADADRRSRDKEAVGRDQVRVEGPHLHEVAAEDSGDFCKGLSLVN